MKNMTLAVIITLGVAGLAGCASNHKTSATTTSAASADKTPMVAPADKTPAGTNVFSDEKARVSYAIGMTLGHNFQQQGVEVDSDQLALGVKDMLAGGKTLLTPEEMHQVLGDFQKVIAAKQQKMREETALKNKAEETAFLSTNKNNPGVVTLPDGLQYIVITNGDGAMPGSNDIVTVNYRGKLLNGTEFDSSYKRGHPSQFPIGNVVHGWTEALLQMPVGSKWKVFVPAELGYGQMSRPGIEPNSLLIFEIELLGAEHPKPPAPITSDIVKVPSMAEMKKGATIEVIKPEDAARAQESQTNEPAK